MASYQFPEGVRACIEIPADNSEPAALPGPAAVKYIRFDPPLDEAYLEKHGHIPLPPYIRRADTVMDHERYQTVYSRLIGSAAGSASINHPILSNGANICYEKKTYFQCQFETMKE